MYDSCVIWLTSFSRTILILGKWATWDTRCWAQQTHSHLVEKISGKKISGFRFLHILLLYSMYTLLFYFYFTFAPYFSHDKYFEWQYFIDYSKLSLAHFGKITYFRYDLMSVVNTNRIVYHKESWFSSVISNLNDTLFKTTLKCLRVQEQLTSYRKPSPLNLNRAGKSS